MINTLTAEQILNAKYPGDIFSCDMDKLKAEYRSLVRIWHPDSHEDKDLATSVMIKLNKLYELGQQMLKDGTWKTSSYVELITLDGKLVRIRPQYEGYFELGKFYVSRTHVIYLVDRMHRRFYDNYRQRVRDLRFADTRMESEFKRFLPNIVDRFETEEFLGVVVSKPEDVIPLRLVLNYFKGQIPDRHMAWILSSLYNLACFLYFNKLAHNGITVDNYFISPQDHNGVLLGGWWYTVPFGEKLIGAPKEVFDVMSMRVKTEKKATYETDLDSIRQIGRVLLGDPLGTSLLRHTTLPQPVAEWLVGGSKADPFKEYELWGQTLKKGWGKREFVEMRVSLEDVYKA